MYHLTKGHDAEVFAQTFRQEEAGFNGSGEELRRTPGASPGRARRLVGTEYRLVIRGEFVDRIGPLVRG